MKTIAIVAVLGLAAAAFFAYSSSQTSETEQAFRSFLEEYRVGYGNSDEYAYRLGVFEQNMKRAEELSILNPEAEFGVTQFADRTPAEMESYMGYIPSAQQENTEVYSYDPSQSNDSYDFSSKMTGVKNQGSCGSCWAFSAVGALEGRYHLTNKKKDHVDIPFAEQQLVDCDKTCNGCNGGLMRNAFNYFKKNGFMKGQDYAYTARQGTCKFDDKKKVDIVRGQTVIKAGDTDGLFSAGSEGPVSVAVDASNWSLYKSGVFSNCSTRLNHGVTLVGAQKEGYWKIRNSWGPTWGEGGHIRLAAGNTCGVLNDAAFPTF